MTISATQIDRQTSQSHATSVEHEPADRWVREFIAAYEKYPPSWPAASYEHFENQEDAAVGLLGIVQPLLARAKSHLIEKLADCENLEHCLEADQFVEAYFAHLPGQVLHIVGRTMVLEMLISKLEGRLQGESPEERYRFFLDSRRRRTAALALPSDYPLLVQQVTARTEQWLSFGCEFARHLDADWPRLRATFGFENSDRVQRVDSRGDRHRSGRSVLVLQFASGRKLVYKPKSLATDRHFQQLAQFLNDNGLDPPLRSLQLLDAGNHGWVEHVEPTTCTSTAQVERFFRRQGTLVALAYLLGGTDFHFENVLPVGEHPMLIDLEAFFHPETEAVEGETAERHAQRILDDSVLSTGLLPQPVWGSQDRTGIDLSGIGAAADQPMPFAAPGWEAAGTDEMRFVRKTAWFVGGQNRVTLNGDPIEPYRYLSHIEEGFESTWRLVRRMRRILLAKDGPIRRFAHDNVRVLLRSTQLYERLRSESFHPDLLRDVNEREQLFQRLWRICEQRPAMRRIVEHELDDLRAGDIPLFTTCPDSLHLWTSDGMMIEDFFQRSGIQCAEERFQSLDDENLQWQHGLIRNSILSLAPAEDTLVGCSTARNAVSAIEIVPNLHAELLDAAGQIGDRLIDLAINGNLDVTWISLQASHGARNTPDILGLNLYDGLPGVALYLGYLGNALGDQRYTDYADRALRAMRSERRHDDPAMSVPGVFSGWSGMVYCLTHLGILWLDETLLDEARQLIARMRYTIDGDEDMDIMAGAAGCLGAILCLYEMRPAEDLLDAAVQCGDRLIAGACEQPHGIGWPIASTSVALTGFSHGAAGFAWALLKLADASGQLRFRDLAEHALEFERASYCSRQRNWLDYRPGSNGDQASPNCVTAWCHGAPGIGLGRLATLSYLDDQRVREEISTAVQTTLKSGFGLNHSLCHGDLGNIELLAQAARRGDQSADARLLPCATAIVQDIRARGWVCGSKGLIETPGLMTGLAGIGYGLLRLALPGQIPSVLTLEAPSKHNSHGVLTA